MVEDQARNRKPGSRKITRCCCGLMCSLGTLIFLVILIVILIFTVFKVKDPTMTLNKITLGTTGNVGRRPVFQLGSNITMTADASVKNPNVGTFKFSNTTSVILYNGVMVGQAYGPPGRAKAHRILRMNTTVEIETAKVLNAPNLSDAIVMGLFTMDSYTRAPGSVKVLFVVKKVVVEMNCTVAFNITSQEIRDQKCKSHVDF